MDKISEIQYPDGTVYQIQDPDVGDIDAVLNEILGNPESISNLVFEINGEEI